MDLAQQGADGFAGRTGADVGPAVPSVETADRVAEEVAASVRYPDQPGLGLIHREPEPCHQVPHRRQSRFPVAGSTADDEVIGIVDDVCPESIAMTVAVPRQQKATEVQIRQ